jgi:hypothetical protein
MTETLLEEESSLFSEEEKAPKHVTQVIHAESTAKCPECGASFSGPWRNRSLGSHRLHRHQVKGTKGQPKKPGPKKTPQTKPLGERVKDNLRTPVPGVRRKPASDIIRRLFVTGAKVVAVVDAPVANCLVFEAAAAGDALDKAIAGSFVDRLVIQKLAGASEKWEGLSSIVALPICIALVSRYPQLYEALKDDMREAVEDVMILSVPTLKAKAERQRKAAGAFQELMSLDPTLASSEDPVGEILRGMLPEYVFNPPEASDAGPPL